MLYNITIESFPTQLRHTIKSDLLSVSHVVPSWVNDLYITYATAGDFSDGAVAEVSCNVEYRSVVIYIRPCYFDFEDYDRRIFYLIHEIVHAQIWPLSNYAEKLMSKLGTDGDASIDILKEECLAKIESVTQDVCRALNNVKNSSNEINVTKKTRIVMK